MVRLGHVISPGSTVLHTTPEVLTYLFLVCRREDLEPMRLLGVGCRQKKILMLSVQVRPSNHSNCQILAWDTFLSYAASVYTSACGMNLI